jgi:hypothetical protein
MSEGDGAWLLEKFGTPQAVYDVGYREGESNREADWQFALDEHCSLPDDVEPEPIPVAEYINRLQAVVEQLRDELADARFEP